LRKETGKRKITILKKVLTQSISENKKATFLEMDEFENNGVEEDLFETSLLLDNLKRNSLESIGKNRLY